jgi:hypothetical protein
VSPRSWRKRRSTWAKAAVVSKAPYLKKSGPRIDTDSSQEQRSRTARPNVTTKNSSRLPLPSRPFLPQTCSLFFPGQPGRASRPTISPTRTGVSSTPVFKGGILTVAPRRNFPKLPPGNESSPDLASRAAGRVLPALDARRVVRGFS